MAVRKRKKIGNKGTPGVSKAKKGKHLRINQCHDFAWSRNLWKEAARQIARVCAVLTVAYLICATSLAASDGLNFIDMIYFISVTTNTIGLGDIAPVNQVNRAAAIIMLPFGLVIISFGISVIIALAYARPFEAPTEDELNHVVRHKANENFLQSIYLEVKAKYDDLSGTIGYRLFVMLVKYVGVLFVGVLFISINERERRKQERLGEEMTLIDCTYFATVLATTVGYGHRIYPQTDSLKLFLTFYMYLSTFVAGSIIGDISTMFLEMKEDAIINIMVESTTWVHKADLFKIGKICESDYVLFKLQQLQMVDDLVRRRLTNRFTELDFERKNRLLVIGRDVPSERQVKKMQEATAGTGKSLIRAWGEMRCELVAEHFREMAERGESLGKLIKTAQNEGGAVIISNAGDKINPVNPKHMPPKFGSYSYGIDDPNESSIFSNNQNKHKNKGQQEKPSSASTRQRPPSNTQEHKEEHLYDDDVEAGRRREGGGGDLRSSREKLIATAAKNSFNNKAGGGGNETPSRSRPMQFFANLSTRLLELHLEDDEIEMTPSSSYGQLLLEEHNQNPVRLSECHDFAWSRTLWRDAAINTLQVASVLTIIYIILGWFLLVRPENMSTIWGCYYLSATLSTVGFGDIAPTKQSTRFSAIFLIPFGLIIIGFLLSFVTAYQKSLPAKEFDDMEEPQVLERRALFETLDQNHDGELTREECVQGAHLMSMTGEEAGELFDSMDTDGNGVIYPFPNGSRPWLHTARGKLTVLFLKLFFTVLTGALFFKLYKPEDDLLKLSWIDAFYFATVTSTSVGYGDITPQTDGGRIFMIFYMLVSTVIVGGVLSEVIDIYVNDFVGEKIIRTIINSTTWVHSADVAKIGVITEADYVLFKLQQMQKVDAEMLDVLIDRFEEIDENANGWLDIGIDVPSAEQVQLMKEELGNDSSGPNIIKLWREKQRTMESVIKAKVEGAKNRAAKAKLPPDAEYTDKLNIEKELIEIRKSRDFGHDISAFSRQTSKDFGPQLSTDNSVSSLPTSNKNSNKNSNDKNNTNNNNSNNNSKEQPAPGISNGFGMFSQLSMVAEGTSKYLSKTLGTSLDDATVSEHSRSSSTSLDDIDDSKPLSPNVIKYKKSKSKEPTTHLSDVTPSDENSSSSQNTSAFSTPSSRMGSTTSSIPHSTASLYATRYDTKERIDSGDLPPPGGDEDEEEKVKRGGGAEEQVVSNIKSPQKSSSQTERGSTSTKSPKPRGSLTAKNKTPKSRSSGPPPVRPRSNSAGGPKEGVEMV